MLRSVFICLALTLNACGTKKVPPLAVIPSPTSASTLPLVIINGTGGSSIAIHSDTWNLFVSGSSNVVTVGLSQVLQYATLSGNQNDLFVGPSTAIAGAILITGTNNTVHLPVGSTITIVNSGRACTVLYDSSVG